jgi:hypothetical protein
LVRPEHGRLVERHRQRAGRQAELAHPVASTRKSDGRTAAIDARIGSASLISRRQELGQVRVQVERPALFRRRIVEHLQQRRYQPRQREGVEILGIRTAPVRGFLQC